MVKALARAFRWRRMLETGVVATVTEIAARERINASYVSRVLRLTLLAPEIVEAILDGRQSAKVTLPKLIGPSPVEWSEQRQHLVVRGWDELPKGGTSVFASSASYGPSAATARDTAFGRSGGPGCSAFSKGSPHGPLIRL